MRSLATSRCRRKDNIKIGVKDKRCENVVWIHQTQYRVQWIITVPFFYVYTDLLPTLWNGTDITCAPDSGQYPGNILTSL
jgi:hypothetical protein